MKRIDKVANVDVVSRENRTTIVHHFYSKTHCRVPSHLLKSELKNYSLMSVVCFLNLLFRDIDFISDSSTRKKYIWNSGKRQKKLLEFICWNHFNLWLRKNMNWLELINIKRIQMKSVRKKVYSSLLHVGKVREWRTSEERGTLLTSSYFFDAFRAPVLSNYQLTTWWNWWK